MTEIVLSFDTEDYVNQDGADGILRTARILQEAGVRGCFNLVGWMAEALVKWGRQDVIDALRYHEIDSHSLTHSFHPTINEYTDLENFQEAKAEFIKQESQCLDIIKKTFGVKEIFAACPPGNSLSYVAHYGYADLGVKIYDAIGIADEARGRPVSYCNMQCVEYCCALEKFLIHLDTLRPATEQEIRDKLTEIANTRNQFIFYHHPSRSIYAAHWDHVNFYGENTPPEKWKAPPRLPAALTEQYYENFKLLVRLIKEDPRFRIVNYETIAQAHTEVRKVTKEMLPDIRRQLTEEFFPVTLPRSLCLADLFHACKAFLLGAEEFECGKVYGFLEEPFAISGPVTVTAADLKESARSIAEGFLPGSIQVGAATLGPADWLRGALSALCGEETVTIEPGPWQIDLDQFPRLRDLNLAHSWVNINFEDHYLSRRARLQSWTIRLPEGTKRKIY